MSRKQQQHQGPAAAQAAPAVLEAEAGNPDGAFAREGFDERHCR